MVKINAVSLDYQPREAIMQKLPVASHEPGMSKFDSAFLCGLLNMVQPKKILEIGVAGGATTAIILQCMENLQKAYEMHSVDISETVWHDNTLKTGWLGEYAKELLQPKHHGFHIGAGVTKYIDIVKGSDFVILDTVHQIPGEILDFLAILPYLSADAVVCLHDIATCQYSRLSLSTKANNYIATNVLFNSVVAEKYINFMPTGEVTHGHVFPNIAAFKISSQTMEDIISVCSCLLIPWNYLPSKIELDRYTTYIHANYDADVRRVYDEAVAFNMVNYGLLETAVNSKWENKKILLYGAGGRGRAIYHELEKMKLSHIVTQWVDQAAEEIDQINNVKIQLPANIDVKGVDFAVIAIVDTAAVAEIKSFLHDKGLNEDKILVC